MASAAKSQDDNVSRTTVVSGKDTKESKENKSANANIQGVLTITNLLYRYNCYWYFDYAPLRLKIDWTHIICEISFLLQKFYVSNS